MPIKLKKVKVKDRYFNYLVILDPGNKTLLRQRKGKGIWQNLWEFPLIESDSRVDGKEIMKGYLKEVPQELDPEIYQFNDDEIVHKLSHQNLHTKFWILKTGTKLNNGVEFDNLDRFPVPVLIADFINTFKI